MTENKFEKDFGELISNYKKSTGTTTSIADRLPFIPMYSMNEPSDDKMSHEEFKKAWFKGHYELEYPSPLRYLKEFTL